MAPDFGKKEAQVKAFGEKARRLLNSFRKARRSSMKFGQMPEMQLCYVLDPDNSKHQYLYYPPGHEDCRDYAYLDEIIRKFFVYGDLNQLFDKQILLGYTFTDGCFLLGDIQSEPKHSLARADNAVRDLGKLIGEYRAGKRTFEQTHCWIEPRPSPEDIERMKQIQGNYFSEMVPFFGTRDITRWTSELDALEKPDESFDPSLYSWREDYPERLGTNEFVFNARSDFYMGCQIIRAIVAKGRQTEVAERLKKSLIKFIEIKG